MISAWVSGMLCVVVLYLLGVARRRSEWRRHVDEALRLTEDE